MSPTDRPVPPAGEEIHLPGGSAQPLLLAIGITTVLLGLTTTLFLVIAGGVLMVLVIAAWIRDAVREYHELPLEHHVPTHDTAPRAQDRAGGTTAEGGA